MKKAQNGALNIVCNSFARILTKISKCCKIKLGRREHKGGGTVYNVLDVCRHIINYSNDHNYGISNLKLQKLLYFVQAYFVSFTSKKEPCFKDKIEAWDFGPVVPVAYHEYKRYGNTDIPYVSHYIEYNFTNFLQSKVIPFTDTVISDEDKKIIDDLIDNFSEYSTTSLVRITHNQSPWIDAQANGKNSVITVDAIRSYFNGK